MSRGFQPSDVWQLRTVGDPRLCPDGSHLALTVTIPDAGTDTFMTAVDVVSLDPRATHRISTVPTACSPRWAPDGIRLAYLSHEDGVSTLWLHDRTRAARRSIAVDGYASHPEWSPDGHKIALTRRATPRAATAIERNEPQVIDSLHYRVDGIGYRPQRQQIVIFDLETQLWAEVTGTGHLADEATWSPDGRLIGYTADRRDGWRDRYDRADLWVRDLTTGEERVLTTGAGPVISPAFSPDGRWIAYLGHEHGSEVDRHLRLYVVPSDGSAPARRLTPTLDRSVCAQMPTGKQFIWLDDSDSVLFLVAERGTVGIARCSMRAATVTDSLVADDRQVDGLDASGDGGLVAFTSQWPDAPSEAHWRIGGHVKAATSYNGAQPWLGSLVPLQRIEWEGSDGAPLEGFAAYPRDRQAGRRYSLVLVVHGGPHGFHPYPAGVWLTQSLAAAGFVVLLPNPRGSGGYDEEFKRQVTQNWGTANFRDVMPLVDVAVADGTADPDRMYLCGTSYGGYLTAFITTRTTRFRAAAMGAGMVNLLSTLGTSDITDYFLHEIGSEPYADPDSFMSRSPLAAAANVSTPTLIIHWDGDLRCPVSQAEEWFTALKLHNVRVRFVRYPGGSHTSSTPSQLVDRIERLVGWFSDPFR